jgi:hypothetical protein
VPELPLPVDPDEPLAERVQRHALAPVTIARLEDRVEAATGIATMLQMNSPSHAAQDILTSYFHSGDAIRSRRVSDIVLTGTVDIPIPPTRLQADWEREISAHVILEPGDVEVMPLARAQVRWPDYRRCVQAASEWTGALGMPDVLASSDVALMACRGARYHHDGAQYGAAAFCNLFLCEDSGQDLHFPSTGLRIPLTRGTIVVFDTGQPHGVIQRDSSGFNAADFTQTMDSVQIFLSWELPIENTHVAHALHIAFDVVPSASLQLAQEQILVNGAPANLCPDSGRWCPVD